MLFLHFKHCQGYEIVNSETEFLLQKKKIKKLVININLWYL